MTPPTRFLSPGVIDNLNERLPSMHHVVTMRGTANTLILQINVSQAFLEISG
jgi:hypothetical protein